MSGLMPAGAQWRHVEVAGRLLSVLHAGSAVDRRAPVVLVHGGGTDSAAISWYRLIEPLSRDREVWAPDLPGFGGSIQVPPVGSPRELAEVLAQLFEALGVDRAVVVGVSMGGDAALNLALEHPGLVEALVLIAPGGLVPTFRNPMAQSAAWLVAQLPDRVLLPALRLANRFSGPALRAMVHDPATLPPEVVDEFVRAARDPRGGIGYLRYNQATLGRRGMLNDLTARVQDVTAPTLLVHGEDDRIVELEGSRGAAARMLDARIVTVPRCGHWVQLEAPDRFLAELTLFLTTERQ